MSVHRPLSQKDKYVHVTPLLKVLQWLSADIYTKSSPWPERPNVTWLLAPPCPLSCSLLQSPQFFYICLLLPQGLWTCHSLAWNTQRECGRTAKASLCHEYRHMVNYGRSVGPRDCDGRDEGTLSSLGSGMNRVFSQPSGPADRLMTGTRWDTLHQQQSRRQQETEDAM